MRGRIKSSGLDRRTLSNARPEDLRRLARFLRRPVQTCGCDSCLYALVEQLARAIQ